VIFLHSGSAGWSWVRPRLGDAHPETRESIIKSWRGPSRIGVALPSNLLSILAVELVLDRLITDQTFLSLFVDNE